MVSYIASRRNRPSWWTDGDWESAQKVNTEVLKNYFEAKVEADEFLVAQAEKRRRRGGDNTTPFQYIDLRPGSLTDDPMTGRVLLGKTPASGKVTREDVAQVAVRLLERGDTNGYYDLLNGEEAIDEAVERVVREGWNSLEGEDLDRIHRIAG